MGIYYKFNNQLQVDMENIKRNLTKSNSIKLVFDYNKKATIEGTHLISVDGVNVGSKYVFSVPSSHNIYFIFDESFNCQYIGKKSTKRGINARLGLHLLENKTKTTKSAIIQVCNYLNSIIGRYRIIYLITVEIEPSYMAEGVESYFIDYFRAKNCGKWVLRK